MTPEEVIDLAAQHHVASESPLFNQQLVAFAAAIEAATIERCCSAIRAEDDMASAEDYMLDSDDCIEVLRALAKKEGS